MIAGVYWLLNKIDWLNNLGRAQKGKKNVMLENCASRYRFVFLDT